MQKQTAEVAPTIAISDKYMPTNGKRIFCPFCQCKIAIQDLPYRCVCGKETRARKIEEMICEDCGEILAIKVCPCCKKHIPRPLYEFTNLCTTITLIGNSGSGKTTFLRQLIPLLRDNIGCIPIHETNELINNDYICLDQYHACLEPTPINSLIPLFFKVPRGTRKESGYMTIFDIAGEHIQNITRCTPSNAMLNSENIIFLIDADYFTVTSPTTNPVLQFINFINHMHPRSRKGVFQKSWLEKIHVATVITKLDKYKSDFEYSSLLYYPKMSYSKRTINYAEIQERSNDIRQWLRNTSSQGRGFINNLEGHFRGNYELFGVFPLGFNPTVDDSRRVCNIGEPVGVVEPILWLLEQNGMR